MCKILKNEIDVNIFEIAISERDDISKTLKSQQIVQWQRTLIFNFLHVLLLQVQEPISPIIKAIAQRFWYAMLPVSV